MAKWTIEPKIRPCIILQRRSSDIIDPRKGWFHCWVETTSGALGLVELEDGKCRLIPYNKIQFVDSRRVEDEYELSHIYPTKECEIHGE